MCRSCPGLPSNQAQGLQGALALTLFTLFAQWGLSPFALFTLPAHSHSHIEDLGMLVLATVLPLPGACPEYITISSYLFTPLLVTMAGLAVGHELG